MALPIDLPMQEQGQQEPQAVVDPVVQPQGEMFGGGLPQDSPQESPQGEQKPPYPSNNKEAQQFSNDILQVLYDDKTHESVVKQLSGIDDETAVQGVGMIAANIVGDRVGDVISQTGRKVEMRLVVDAVQAVIPELIAIANKNDLFEMADEQKTQARDVSIQILDEMGNGEQ